MPPGWHMFDPCDMSVIGARELRRSASEILKEIEAAEIATITVSGRAVAQIVPIKARM